FVLVSHTRTNYDLFHYLFSLNRAVLQSVRVLKINVVSRDPMNGDIMPSSTLAWLSVSSRDCSTRNAWLGC
ncbi:hypothetical protein, partial [Nostoc sp. UCD121]|uniref:hypothetical protein n=1 Tax=Nostoc sp. UCD121 TaxID=2681305 RepID=UPI001C8AFB6D